MALTSASRDRTKARLSATSCSPFSPRHSHISGFSPSRPRFSFFSPSFLLLFSSCYVYVSHTLPQTHTWVLIMSDVRVGLAAPVHRDSDPVSSSFFSFPLLLSSTSSPLLSSSPRRGNWILSMSIMRRCRRINR